jgi:hypothetical protein
MGRPERPLDPDAGEVQRLAWQLRRLREAAGRPSYRRMAERAHYSPGTLADAARGERLPSLDVTLAYVRACGGDLPEWRSLWLIAARAAATDRVGVAAPDVADEPRCPYLGLLAFQSQHAEWFFGRVQLVDRLMGRIDRLPVVGLFGASGSGKSSVLRAGLVGAVQADGGMARRWRIVILTPGARPCDALIEQLAKLTDTEPKSA